MILCFDQHFLASTVSVQGNALHYGNKVHAQNNSNNGDCVLCTRAHPRGGSVQTSPTGTPVNSRRGRQLPQLPPKGTLERSTFVFLCSSFFSPCWLLLVFIWEVGLQNDWLWQMLWFAIDTVNNAPNPRYSSYLFISIGKMKKSIQ